MGKRNQISVSPFQGENILYVGGFNIHIMTVIKGTNEMALEFEVYRKGTRVLTCSTLQQAVKWCED